MAEPGTAGDIDYEPLTFRSLKEAEVMYDSEISRIEFRSIAHCQLLAAHKHGRNPFQHVTASHVIPGSARVEH